VSDRQRSPVTTLLAERRLNRVKGEQLDRAAAVARERHDPFKAHPGQVGILSPWLAGCLDCEREERIANERGHLMRRQFDTLIDLAAATESTHSKRLEGQRKTASIRSTRVDAAVLEVRRYCEERNLPFTKRKLAQIIHQERKIPLRTLQRALQVINKK
jgi:hypothetical protein